MIPGRSRIHPTHKIVDDKRNGIDALRAAIIYGANASGKSNFCRAIDFAQDYIVRGRNQNEKIHNSSFKLDTNEKTNESEFKFDFSVGPKYYAYGFKIDQEKIYEEWLYQITKNNEVMLYERKTNEKSETTVDFGKIKLNSEERNFAKFLAKATPRNQLFITEMKQRNFGKFTDVYNWFADHLFLIFPESKYFNLLADFEKKHDFSNYFQQIINSFDIRINDFELKKIPEVELYELLPKELIKDIRKDLLKSKNDTTVIKGPNKNLLLLSIDQKSNLQVKKLVTHHKALDDDSKIIFDLDEESDGTKRLFDLIPILYEIQNNEAVFIIDELDRSMHPSLTRKFLELFFKISSNSRSQIIVTTHEPSLMDLDLLRRDEIWFIELDKDFSSKMYSLEDYTPRYDKDIEKGYLSGRYGAIPIFGDTSKLGW
jgi:hypothetical protein